MPSPIKTLGVFARCSSDRWVRIEGLRTRITKGVVLYLSWSPPPPLVGRILEHSLSSPTECFDSRRPGSLLFSCRWWMVVAPGEMPLSNISWFCNKQERVYLPASLVSAHPASVLTFETPVLSGQAVFSSLLVLATKNCSYFYAVQKLRSLRQTLLF